MKLLATCTPFEALPPSVWAAVRKQLENVGKTWGLDITVDENPTVTEAIANFWKWNRIAEDARSATEDV